MIDVNTFRRTVRALITAAALTLVFTVGASAQAPAATADSLSRALATFWGTAYKTDGMSAADKDSFIKGVQTALTDPGMQNNAYNQGVTQGMNMATGLHDMEQLGMKVDREAFLKAIVAVLKGESVGFTQTSAGEFIDSQIAPAIGARRAAPSAASQAEFIAAAIAADGAVVTDSGLVFKVLTEGEGDFPTDADRVNIEYTARLSDGTVFDKTDAPVNFDIVRLIPGFSEGLKMMRPGGEYRLTIPAKLGYGERGAGDVIPPGAALEFTVRLLSVDRGAASK